MLLSKATTANAYAVSNDVYDDVNALFKVVISHDNCIAL